jgi:hypothetical protein
MPFKNCAPFKVASGTRLWPKQNRPTPGLSRIVKHVSGHLSPQYVLILLGDTGPSARIGGFQPAGMADIGQNREPWLFSVPPPPREVLLSDAGDDARSWRLRAMTAIPAILAALCLHPSAQQHPTPYASTRTLKDLSFSTPEICHRNMSQSRRIGFKPRSIRFQTCLCFCFFRLIAIC